MAKLGTPLDIDKYLSVAAAMSDNTSRINMLGIELEGGWLVLPRGTELTRDSSIHFRGDLPLQGIGELPSPPLALNEWTKWITKFYPSHVNETCGLHVHLSFKSALAYHRLIDPTYPATIVKYIRRWAEGKGFAKDHPIWPRLDDKNEFCQHKFYADSQVRDSRKDFDHHRPGCRYTVMSYHYSRLRTIECRLLPMFDTVELGTEAVQQVVNITSAYLLATNKKENKIPIVVEASGGSVNEEIVGYI